MRLSSDSSPQFLVRLMADRPSARLSRSKCAPAARDSSWLSVRRPLIWLLLCITVFGVALPGCSGCRKKVAQTAEEEEEEKKKKKKKAPKKDFEVQELISYPHDPDQVQNFVKPGHWVTLMQRVRANNFDFQADLEVMTTDSDGRPLPIEKTNAHLKTSLPAPLPKGQDKTFETTVFVPRREANPTTNEVRKVWFDSRLVAARGGGQVFESRKGTTDLDRFEYFMVVLAREPNDYRYLKVLDTVTPPSFSAESGRLFHYRVVLPRAEGFVPVRRTR